MTKTICFKDSEKNTSLPFTNTNSPLTSKVSFFVAFVFSLLAIVEYSKTSSSDSRLKLFSGVASFGYLFGIFSAANIGNRIFRTAVLQEGVRNDGYLERGIITLYRKCNHFADFDHRRAEETYETLRLIDFQPTQVQLSEPIRELEIIEFDSKAFEKTIEAAGGKWEKRETRFVIVPPENQNTQAWQNFERGIKKFHWHKEKDLIVTCENADLISDEQHRLFIYASNSHVIINLRRAGFYLGCKQSVLIYSPSGCGRSTGYASEGQHYVDSVEIYKNRVEGRFEPQFVWLTASCGNCPMIVHLKSRLHELPVNLILESGFVDLQRDFIDPQGSFVKRFAKSHLDALSSPISSQGEWETQYNLEKMMKNRQLAGKVVIVTVANDQRLNPAVADRMERIFKERCRQVLHVKFQAEGSNPHSARYFFYQAPRRTILEFVNN